MSYVLFYLKLQVVENRIVKHCKIAHFLIFIKIQVFSESNSTLILKFFLFFNTQSVKTFFPPENLRIYNDGIVLLFFIYS